MYIEITLLIKKNHIETNFFISKNSTEEIISEKFIERTHARTQSILYSLFLKQILFFFQIL